MMGRQQEAGSSSDPPPSTTAGSLTTAPICTQVEYVDIGPHWCKSCNMISTKLFSHLEHLQTGSHMKVYEPFQLQLRYLDVPVIHDM